MRMGKSGKRLLQPLREQLQKSKIVLISLFLPQVMCASTEYKVAENVFFKRDKNGNCLSLSLSLRDKNAFLSVPQKLSRRGTKTRFPFLSGTGTKTYI